MTKQELLDKAVYIQYPLNYTTYKQYNVGKEINKLPLPEKGMMYDKWKYNDNHFIPLYHRKYSLPLLEKVLKFGYNENDFILKERTSNGFDISVLWSKKEHIYEIYGFNRNEYFDNLKYDDIITSHIYFNNITDYHKQYKYPHENSRLINKTIDNNRILFISGDSQMIPDIPILSCYFKEIWYFDNRNNLVLSDKYKNVFFTDVLVEVGRTEQSDYVDKNFR